MEIKSSVIIFCLYYDERTKSYIYDNYPSLIGDWLYPVEMPATTKYMENHFYITWLAENKHLWQDKRYVGVVSWKFNQKIHVPDLSNYDGDEDFVGFYMKQANLMNHTSMWIPHFPTLWPAIMQRMGYELNDIMSPNIPYFVYNYWMCKPDWMVRYIEYLDKIMQLMETWPDIQERLYSEAIFEIPPHMNHDRLMKIFQRPYYTHHCFVLERVSPFFFWVEGAEMKALQTGE